MFSVAKSCILMKIQKDEARFDAVEMIVNNFILITISDVYWHDALAESKHEYKYVICVVSIFGKCT